MGEKTYRRCNGLWEKMSPDNLVRGNKDCLWHRRSSYMAPNDRGDEDWDRLESWRVQIGMRGNEGFARRKPIVWIDLVFGQSGKRRMCT